MAQTPTKYELAINIKKALGLEMLAQVARRADSNKRTDPGAAGNGGTSAPNPNQHAGHAEQPCSCRQQSSHGVLSLAINNIGEPCEAEGI
jgi:hypothetical protein